MAALGDQCPGVVSEPSCFQKQEPVTIMTQKYQGSGRWPFPTETLGSWYFESAFELLPETL